MFLTLARISLRSVPYEVSAYPIEPFLPATPLATPSDPVPPWKVPAGTFQGGQGSDGVANGVAGKNGSIGYAETSYGTERKLILASVKNNNGEFVQPTATATAAFINGFTVGDKGTITIDYTKKIKGSYTLAGYTYAMVYTFVSSKDKTKQAAVKNFLNYVLNDCAKKNAARLGYAPLTGALKELAVNQVMLIE